MDLVIEGVTWEIYAILYIGRFEILLLIAS